MTGIVYIIGAGPGDPGLITVKGLSYLQKADVVLYDRLAAKELLGEAKESAEMIDVGKAPQKHRFSQEVINAMLIEKALEGKIVARLKGGDPFVFGRGGEECQALAKAGIPFEVVPGISSAIAVPAYAGIPVTQRGISTSFTVVTGHESDANSEMDWDVLTGTGTVVFLMGVKHLAEITSQLLAHGRKANTPAALIEQGTTKNQVVLCGTLENITQQADQIKPPAILVVGDVVNLRNEINWYANQSELATAHTQYQEQI
jgi:uroporphyrinogen III methyltransferase / synthase